MKVINESTGLIKIVKTPAGEAPLWVLQAWVGLVLPCNPSIGFSDDGEQGVLSGERSHLNRYGYSVPQDQAIAILEDKNFRIAVWWKGKGFPHQDEYFVFSFEEAEVVSGVTPQKIIIYDDCVNGR